MLLSFEDKDASLEEDLQHQLKWFIKAFHPLSTQYNELIPFLHINFAQQIQVFDEL